jgi:hypothetical protein
MTSAGLMAMRRGRLPSFGSTGVSSELITMPYGFDFGIGELTSLISPVAGSSQPSAPRALSRGARTV